MWRRNAGFQFHLDGATGQSDGNLYDPFRCFRRHADSAFPWMASGGAAPAKVARKNPFTGDVINVEDWDPGPPAELPPGLTLFDSRGREAIAPVLPPVDEYQSVLEDESPILLRTVPHSAMKGISEVELIALAELMVGRPEPPARLWIARKKRGSSVLSRLEQSNRSRR